MVFQMHFRPQLWNGVADVETMAIAEALLEIRAGVNLRITPSEYIFLSFYQINPKYKLISFLVN